MWSKILLTLWLASCGADAVTTHIDLNHGAYEANPLMVSNKWVIDGAVGAEMIGGSILYLKVKDPKKKKALRIMMVVTAVTHGVAAYGNVGIKR